MATAPKRITVAAGSEIARLLDEAALTPLLLEKNGRLFRIDTVDKERENIWADYDPKAAREALHAVAGSWKHLDTEKLKRSIYKAREDGTRPTERP